MKLDRVKHAGLLAKLEPIGDAWELRRWHDGNPDYVSKYGFTSDDIPGLLAIALDWAYREVWPENQDDLTIFAPVHAWRTLAQLRAVEVVEPLLSVIPILDELDDDLYVEDFQWVFGFIGRPAVEPLRRFAQDYSHPWEQRISAVDGLCRIAEREPSFRPDCVRILAGEMERFAVNDPGFNSLLVSHLMEQDKEHLTQEIVEKAHAADRVDETMCGSWGEVKKVWGITGMGIAQDKRRAHWWKWMGGKHMHNLHLETVGKQDLKRPDGGKQDEDESRSLDRPKKVIGSSATPKMQERKLRERRRKAKKSHRR